MNMTLTVVANLLQAAPDENSQDWRQVVSWVLGLPVALAAALGTIYVIPKARRENRKLELEILEKERALGIAQANEDPAQVATAVAEPIFETRRAQNLILRFVLLYLLLQAWSVVSGLLGSALAGAQIGLNNAVEADASVWVIAGYLLAAAVASLPGVIRSLLFVLVGWPLLLDVAKLLRFDLPDFTYKPVARRMLILIAIIAALVPNLMGASFSLFRF
ncbi:hypothetical protein [Kribbella sp. NPDC000426]|uniref:hypothetical protein n=1 Tax=Kribbella sp. NPDC000426 TaxID=3154255 RepID=UPI0033245FFA